MSKSEIQFSITGGGWIMVTAVLMEQPATYNVDQDGLWKKAIRDLFEDSLLFFAPELHAHIDFSKTPDFLQQELFQEVADKRLGRRMADQIVKVTLKDGEEKWILIHVEVQSENEANFSARMFQYFYRIFDTYGQKIVAFAIMTSPHKSETPAAFRYNYFGTKLSYAYNTRKIIDYDKKELRQSNNLFSKIVLAAKYLHETKDKDEQRFVFKRRLMREIVRNRDYSRTSVQAAFHFIDYLLRLPTDWERKLSDSMYPLLGREKELMELYNKENAPPTIANAFEMERLEGKVEGKIEGKIEERRNIALNLLKQNLALDMIATATGLSIDEVREIQVKMN